jgi:hypothetical protein
MVGTKKGLVMRKWLVVLTALSVMAVGACSPENLAERIIEQGGGVDNVEIDENSGSVKIEVQDDEGDSSAVIGGGEIPSDFPVPVPDGGTVMAVVTQGGDNSISMTFPQSEFDSLKSFYDSYATSAGEVVNKFETSNPPGVGWTIQDGATILNISLADNGAEVVLAIVVVTSG